MLFDDTYRTIAAPAEGLFRDRGSKFLAFAYPLTSENELREKIAALKKEHFSAVHHCWAIRLGADKQFFRSNDDGEPSGTAGRPILGQIQSNDLTNIAIVVVRYFGGTLLGVSGLINAYKASAADALANAQIIGKTIREVYELKFPYAAMNTVMKLLKNAAAEQWAQQFEIECSLRFAVRKSDADQLCEALKQTTGVSVRFIETN